MPPPTQSEAKILNPKRILIILKLAISWGGGGIELFGGEASPAPPSLDETLQSKSTFVAIMHSITK